jgi:hypothetical protein
LPNLDKAKAYVAKAEALLQVAFIERDQAGNELGHYELKAPADGVVTSIIHPGYFVPEGGGKILAQIGNAERERTAREISIQRLARKLAEYQKQKDELLKVYTPSAREIRTLDETIREMTQVLEKEKQAQQSASAPDSKGQ